MSTEGTNPAEELSPSLEQTAIKPIEEETPAPEPAPDDPPKPEPKAEKDEAPVDPRAARIEALAEKRRENVSEELEESRQAMTPVAPEPEPQPVPQERMIKLKIRGEVVEMPESEVIARAQKVDAADQYLSEARGLLDDAKRTIREPQPAPQPAPQPPPQPEKVDALSRAIEVIQTGGDAAEAKAILDAEINDRAEAAAARAIDNRSLDQRGATYDSDYNSGFAQAAADHQDMMSNPVGQTTVRSLTGGLQAHVIAEHLPTLAPEVQQAFSAAGITPETLKSYNPEDASALYRDMLLKGYRLPRPSEIVRAAAKTVADFYAGGTKPAQAQHQEPSPQPSLNRTERKEAIVQPPRTAIPKPTSQPAPPRSESQRAASARQELRGARRRGQG